MNDYYSAGELSDYSLARASGPNAQFQAIETGFGKLPAPEILQQGRLGFVTAGGTANAILLTVPGTITAYAAGMSFRAVVPAQNTGPVTININSIGVKQLLGAGGYALSGGDLRAGSVMEVTYDGAAFRVTNGSFSEQPVASPLLARLAAQAPTFPEFATIYDPSQLVDQWVQVQAWADSLSNSGVGRGQMPFRPYINSPVYVRPNTFWEGIGRGGEPSPKTNFLGGYGSTIVCGPNGSVNVQGGGKIDGINVISTKAALVNTSTPSDAQTKIAAWTGTGVNIFGADVGLSNMLICGFAKGVVSDSNERWSFDNLNIDCLTGMELSNTTDTGMATRLHMWPFWVAHRYGVILPSVALSPYATGLKVTNVNDGCLFNTALMYGFGVGLDHAGSYGCDFSGIWIDNEIQEAIIKGSIGLRTSGACAGAKFRGIHVDSHAINYDFGHAPGVGIDASTLSSGVAGSAQVRLGTGSGRIDGLRLVGGVTAGRPAIAAVAGVGRWHIDGVTADTNTGGGPLVGADAGGAVSTTDARNLTFTGVQDNSPGTFDEKSWRSFVAAASVTDQALVATTVTTLAYPETADSFGEFASNTFTATRAGEYLVDLSYGFAPTDSTNGYVNIMLYRNGTEARRLFQQNIASTAAVVGTFAPSITLAAGDVLTVRAQLERGGVALANRNILRISKKEG